jgi:hypothetical protein
MRIIPCDLKEAVKNKTGNTRITHTIFVLFFSEVKAQARLRICWHCDTSLGGRTPAVLEEGFGSMLDLHPLGRLEKGYSLLMLFCAA